MIDVDAYAEAFRSIYSEVLVTADNRRWLDAAVSSATGYASSTLGCDCEAGVDKLTEDTPDGRAGALLQFHVACFKKGPERQLELALIHRVSQCLLTCPTTAVWNASEGEATLDVGKKIGFFGDGFQREEERDGRRLVVVPCMADDFIVEKSFGYAEGVMGGNLWIFGETGEAALAAAEKAVAAIAEVDGVVTPFPGGVCRSGSKAGSRYKFLVASTNHPCCPSLRGEVETQLQDNESSVQEIVIDGRSEEAVKEAMLAGARAADVVEGVTRVSAGNYGGRLGKYRIPLR